MNINTLTVKAPFPYSLTMLQDEVRQLLETGAISRSQPIYSLCQYIPAREWMGIELELEKWDYLLRDRIGDLLGTEKWDND